MSFEGIIYRLITDDTKSDTAEFMVYVGSTIHDLNIRLAQHEAHYRMYKEGRHNFISSFKIFESSWYEISVIEKVMVSSMDELLTKEREAIEKLRLDPDYTVLNQNLPIRTPEEKRNAVKKYHSTAKGKQALSKAMKKYYQRKKAKLEQKEQQPPQPPL